MTEIPTREENVIPLRAARALASVERENEQLSRALELRITIEQAKGAVSARLGTTPEVAFELMRGLARSQQRDMYEFAAEIVANGGRLDV
jgi:AmiR/NasT family two-component response regulator